jgi:hypothetical protein
LIPGIAFGPNQDEERVIAALSADSLTVTLDQPLVNNNHGGIYGYPEAVPVGNLSRNVLFTSENTTDLTRRGHIMFMHNQDVVIDSARFAALGRTDALVPQTFPTLDANGNLIPGTDSNTIGRYAVHFHIRVGATLSQTPAVIRNSAVEGSPKHGIVNHGGYVLIEGNVAYNNNGAAIFAENGSEIGTIAHNLLVRSNGSGDNGPSRQPPPGRPIDLGNGGYGVWSESGGVDITDNVAIGHSGAAYELFFFGQPDASVPPNTNTVFLTQNLRDPSIAGGRPYINPQNVPAYFARNIGMASADGLVTWDLNLDLSISNQNSLIADSRFVFNTEGWCNVYTRQVTLRNVQIIGCAPQDFGVTAFLDDGILGNFETAFIDLENVTVDGYAAGYNVPAHGTNVINGGFYNGIVKINVGAPWGGSLVINNVQFGTLRGERPYKILLSNDFSNQNLKVFPLYLQPFRLVYNGQQVYYDGQGANFVPFPSGFSPELDGKTNQQLWNQYRLAVGGRLAPAGLTLSPDISGGSFGPEVPFDPALTIPTTYDVYGVYGWPDPISVYNPVGFVVQVVVSGQTYSSGPTDLHQGWNLVPIQTNTGIRNVLLASPSSAPARSGVAAPTGLVAVGVSGTQIRLAWTDNAANESGYRVERSRDGVNWSVLATLSANSTWYLDTTVSTGTTYYYRVRAFNSTTSSAYSNQTTVTTVPAAPSGLRAARVGAGRINLTWNDVAGETGFLIETSLDGIHWTLLATTAAHVTSYLNTGLRAGTTYYYRVQAIDAGGVSSYSSPVSARA